MPTSTINRENPNGANGTVSGSSSRFRHRKISVKQKLQVLSATDVKDLEQDELQQRELYEIETGVEKNEEREEHLHKILQKNQLKLKEDLYIPTPDASRVWKDFGQLYYGKFQEPVSYIQFSAQLEECCGTFYNMDESDEAYLANHVNFENCDGSLTEDEFENLMANFESAVKEKQPFLAMDPKSVCSYEELKPVMLKIDIGDVGIKSELSRELQMETGAFLTKFDSPFITQARPMDVIIEKYGAQVYEYWCKRKIEVRGGTIIPYLRAERSTDKDDNNPYFCFRRREVRQARKTRRADTQNSQKLRLLYQQLQYTKDLALLVAKREKLSLEMLQKDMHIFQLRCDIKPLKRELKIKKDDEDLVSHKKSKLVSSVVTNRGYLNSQSEANVFKRNKTIKTKDRKLLVKQHSADSRKQAQMQTVGHSEMQEVSQSQQSGAGQVQQETPSVSHVYVKLPSSKIPDIVLEDVGKLLSIKERNTKTYLEEKMRRRKEEDGDAFFNLTDDPYNPIFEISVPPNVAPGNAPFSSIVSSKFEIDRSYYLPNLQDYITGTTNDINVYNKDGDVLDIQKYKRLEFYNLFEENREIHTREFPIRFRKRIDRCGIEYLDRRDISCNSSDFIAEFTDFSIAVEQEEKSDVINVYDSHLDQMYRLHDKWKYASDYNSYGIKFSDEPSRLNQISNETQVIRIGTMLGTKSYEQLRDATSKYRQNLRIQRKKFLNSQRQQQQQQPHEKLG